MAGANADLNPADAEAEAGDYRPPVNVEPLKKALEHFDELVSAAARTGDDVTNDPAVHNALANVRMHVVRSGSEIIAELERLRVERKRIVALRTQWQAAADATEDDRYGELLQDRINDLTAALGDKS